MPTAMTTQGKTRLTTLRSGCWRKQKSTMAAIAGMATPQGFPKRAATNNRVDQL